MGRRKALGASHSATCLAPTRSHLLRVLPPANQPKKDTRCTHTPLCRRPSLHASHHTPGQVSAVEKVIDDAAALKSSLSGPAAHELDKFRQEEDPLHGHGIDRGMALAGTRLH